MKNDFGINTDLFTFILRVKLKEKTCPCSLDRTVQLHIPDLILRGQQKSGNRQNWKYWIYYKKGIVTVKPGGKKAEFRFKADENHVWYTSDFIRKRMCAYDAEFLCGNAPFRRVLRLWHRACGNHNHCWYELNCWQSLFKLSFHNCKKNKKITEIW